MPVFIILVVLLVLMVPVVCNFRRTISVGGAGCV